ncbi:hypothetical protein YC2023_117460 [Brassica napus]
MRQIIPDQNTSSNCTKVPESFYYNHSFAHPLNPARSADQLFEISKSQLPFSTFDDSLENVRFSSLPRMPGFPKSSPELRDPYYKRREPNCTHYYSATDSAKRGLIPPPLPNQNVSKNLQRESKHTTARTKRAERDRDVNMTRRLARRQSMTPENRLHICDRREPEAHNFTVEFLSPCQPDHRPNLTRNTARIESRRLN